MTTIESIVIVKNQHGSVATLRFSNPEHDRFISSHSKQALYALIEKHVKRVTNND